MFDFGDLIQPADITLKIPEHNKSIFVFIPNQSVRSKIGPEIEALNSQGFRVQPMSGGGGLVDYYLYPPIGADTMAIAERIATTLEGLGLTVLRLAGNRSPVQSFLLV